METLSFQRDVAALVSDETDHDPRQREDAMSDDQSVRTSVWVTATPSMGRQYGLMVRDHGLTTAISLLTRSLPYAMARFGILLGCAVACIIWIAIAFGGASWLGTHVAGAFGVVWLLLCLAAAGFVWGTILRYV